MTLKFLGAFILGDVVVVGFGMRAFLYNTALCGCG
jgi:hypothetical protein